LVAGKLVASAHLRFEILNPSSDTPAGPAIAFYSPVECLTSLEKCLHHITGLQSNLRQLVGPLKPAGFDYQVRNGLNSTTTVIAAAGWPDTTGGSVLSVPNITDVDHLMLLLSFTMCFSADCLVIVVQRLSRAQINSLTQLIGRKMSKRCRNWLIVFHDLETKEEYEV
jgi:hypothetical protein